MDNFEKNRRVAYVMPIGNELIGREGMAHSTIFNDCFTALSQQFKFETPASLPTKEDFLSNSALINFENDTLENANYTKAHSFSAFYDDQCQFLSAFSEKTANSNGFFDNEAIQGPCVGMADNNTSVQNDYVVDDDLLSEDLQSNFFKNIDFDANDSVSHYLDKLCTDFEEEGQNSSVEEIKQRNRDRRALINKCWLELMKGNDSESDSLSSESLPTEDTKINTVAKVPDLGDHSIQLNQLAYEAAELSDSANVDYSKSLKEEGHSSYTKLKLQFEAENHSSDIPFMQGPNELNVSHNIYLKNNCAQAILQRNNSCLIIIDGTDVALGHGKKKIFSCRGIEISVDYFLKKGHTEVYALVPQWRLCHPTHETPIADQHLLLRLYEQGHLQYIPSKKVGTKRIIHHEERVMLKLAAQSQGVIMSNKHFNNLWEEVGEWREIIEKRVLMYKFVGDILLIPEDPLGRDGPRLDDFLSSSQAAPALEQEAPRAASSEWLGYRSPSKGWRNSAERNSPASGAALTPYVPGNRQNRDHQSPQNGRRPRIHSPQSLTVRHRRLSSPMLSASYAERTWCDAPLYSWQNGMNPWQTGFYPLQNGFHPLQNGFHPLQNGNIDRRMANNPRVMWY